MVVITTFIYENIIAYFGCPLEIILDQEIHFINTVIEDLIDNHIIKYCTSAVYYP